MTNSALIQYIRRLNAKDLREINKFVRSPYFNTQKELVLLLDYILDSLSPSAKKRISKEKAFAILFPQKPYQEKKLSYIMSDLLRLIKRYLAISVAEQEQAQQQLYLCRALRQRRMQRQFLQELENAHKKLKKQKLRNAEYYYNNYLLKQEELGYTIVNLDHRQSGTDLLEKVSNSLTTFYITELLRQGCDILASKSLKSHDYNLDLLEEVLRYIAKNEIAQIPAVSIYYHNYQAFKALENEEMEISEGHFKSIKTNIQHYWSSFSAQEIRDIYTLAVNYCIQRLNRGDRNYIKEAFDLYRSGLENQVWLENGILSVHTYKNIARLGIALQEEAWVKGFIEDFKNNLPPKERKQYWQYNLAYLFFQKGDYANAMELLRQVEFKDVLNNLDTRRMLLRCYYELEETFALEYLLDSFQKYIQRQKNIGYHKNNYLNLIRFVRKKLQTSPLDKEKLKKLAQEIYQTEQVAEKNWLLKQIEK